MIHPQMDIDAERLRMHGIDRAKVTVVWKTLFDGLQQCKEPGSSWRSSKHLLRLREALDRARRRQMHNKLPVKLEKEK
jgi:hypothetical protein